MLIESARLWTTKLILLPQSRDHCANICFSNDRNPNDYQISPDTPSATTFWSESPDGSPQDPLMSGTIRDFSKDVGNLNSFGAPSAPTSKSTNPSHAPNADIAPWASETSLGAHPSASGNIYDKSNGKSQGSSLYRPDTGHSGTSDSPDPLFWRDDRRPSVISATSVSSQTSNSRPTNGRRAHNKKIAGFFGEDSRESSKGSDTSVATTGRENSISSRSKRNNSVFTSSTDGRPISETSSRARTPPSSEVTPWLFQDFKVSPRVRVCCTRFTSLLRPLRDSPNPS